MKKKTLTNYYVRPLQEQIFKNGNLIYNNPNLKEIASFGGDISKFVPELVSERVYEKYGCKVK